MEELNKLKVVELKQQCKQAGVEKYYKMNKEQLIQALIKYRKTNKSGSIKLGIKPEEKTNLLDIKIELFGHLKQLGRTPKKVNKSAEKLEFKEIISLYINVDKAKDVKESELPEVKDNEASGVKGNESSNVKEGDVSQKTRTVKYLLTLIEKGVELEIRCDDCVVGSDVKEKWDPVCKHFVIEKNNLEMVMELWKSIVQYLKEVVYNFGEWLENKYENKSAETISTLTTHPVLTTHSGEIFELNNPIPPRLENKQKSRPFMLNRRLPTKRKSD